MSTHRAKPTKQIKYSVLAAVIECCCQCRASWRDWRWSDCSGPLRMAVVAGRSKEKPPASQATFRCEPPVSSELTVCVVQPMDDALFAACELKGVHLCFVCVSAVGGSALGSCSIHLYRSFLSLHCWLRDAVDAQIMLRPLIHVSPHRCNLISGRHWPLLRPKSRATVCRHSGRHSWSVRAFLSIPASPSVQTMAGRRNLKNLPTLLGLQR